MEETPSQSVRVSVSVNNDDAPVSERSGARADGTSCEQRTGVVTGTIECEHISGSASWCDLESDCALDPSETYGGELAKLRVMHRVDRKHKETSGERRSTCRDLTHSFSPDANPMRRHTNQMGIYRVGK